MTIFMHAHCDYSVAGSGIEFWYLSTGVASKFCQAGCDTKGDMPVRPLADNPVALYRDDLRAERVDHGHIYGEANDRAKDQFAAGSMDKSCELGRRESG
jgi:hypothetical protein